MMAENPGQAVEGYVRQIVNTRATNGATALHVVASLKVEASSWQQKTRMLQLLLSNGAEFSTRSDAKLRAELAKYPAVRRCVRFNSVAAYVQQ